MCGYSRQGFGTGNCNQDAGSRRRKPKGEERIILRPSPFAVFLLLPDYDLAVKRNPPYCSPFPGTANTPTRAVRNTRVATEPTTRRSKSE